MKELISRIPINKKIMLVPIMAFFADILIFGGLYLKMRTHEYFRSTLELIIKANNINPAALTAQSRNELYQLFHMNLITILSILIFYHLIIYIFYVKQKSFSKKYIRFLSLTAVVICSLGMVTSITSSVLLSVLFLLFGAFYFLIFQIDKSFSFEKPSLEKSPEQ